MIFKIYNSDFGIKLNGIPYDFDHVVNLVIEDPESVKLIRGANGKNKLGLTYTEGLKEPKKWTVTIMGMSAALFGVLSAAYAAKDRMDVYCVDRSDGSSKMAKNAVLSQVPQQLSIDEGSESMNVALAFESFDTVEVHKS